MAEKRARATIFLKYAEQEWPVILGAAIAAVFGVNDALDIVHWKYLDHWLFVLAFGVFAAGLMYRVVRLHERLDDKERFAKVLFILGEDIASGHQIIDECGRPADQMRGAPPTYFMDHCLPKLNAWSQSAGVHVADGAPEYLPKFNSYGNVTHDTDKKPAYVQQLEARLKQLEWITDDLRQKMHGA